MTDAFYTKYCDEAYAFITQESLTKKSNELKNEHGFNWAQLEADVQAVA
jgi:hypothetical protein